MKDIGADGAGKGLGGVKGVPMDQPPAPGTGGAQPVAVGTIGIGIGTKPPYVAPPPPPPPLLPGPPDSSASPAPGYHPDPGSTGTMDPSGVGGMGGGVAVPGGVALS